MGDITQPHRSLPEILAEWRQAERRLGEVISPASRAALEQEVERLRAEYHIRSAQSQDGETNREGPLEVDATTPVRLLRPAP